MYLSYEYLSIGILVLSVCAKYMVFIDRFRDGYKTVLFRDKTNHITIGDRDLAVGIKPVQHETLNARRPITITETPQ